MDDGQLSGSAGLVACLVVAASFLLAPAGLLFLMARLRRWQERATERVLQPAAVRRTTTQMDLNEVCPRISSMQLSEEERRDECCICLEPFVAADEEYATSATAVDPATATGLGGDDLTTVAADGAEEEEQRPPPPPPSAHQKTLRRLPCGHVFHAACIDKWVTSGKSCAMCRARAPRLLKLARALSANQGRLIRALSGRSIGQPTATVLESIADTV